MCKEMNNIKFEANDGWEEKGRENKKKKKRS